eukprot:924523-Karenia_brevis.AAC.1
MVGSTRSDGEDWPEFMRRATHTCEALAPKSGCTDWVHLQRKRKFDIAGKCACRSDSRRSHRLLGWRP